MCVCRLTSVVGVCAVGVERVQQVDGGGGPAFAAVVLLMVRRAQAVLIQLALAVPQMPGQT